MPAYRATFTLVALLLCAACASRSELSPEQRVASEVAALRSAIVATVPDPARQARAAKAADGMSRELLAFDATAARHRDQLRKLNTRADATPEQFASLLKELDGERTERRHQLVSLHLELLSATTAAEWKVLAPRERTLLSVSME